MKTRGYKVALGLIALTASGLLWWGVTLLSMPPVYRLARMNNPMLHYQAYVLITLALLLGLFHRPAVKVLLWLSGEIHRLASIAMMFSVVVIDGSMHLFNIPHMEGWWLPLFGGSAVISSFGAWLHHSRKCCEGKSHALENENKS